MSLYQVIVFIHLLTAIIWMGGMVFVYAVVLPFLKKPQHRNISGPLSAWVSRRFRRMAQVSLVVLVVTGAWAAHHRGATWGSFLTGEMASTPFGQALYAKVFLVFLLTVLSLTADFLIVPYLQRFSQVAEKQSVVAFWQSYLSLMGHFNVSISVLIVGLAVVLVRGWPW